MVLDEEIYLQHFGVKGMHWGVHKREDLKVNASTNKIPDEQNKENTKTKHDGKLSPFQKKVLIGAGITAALLAAYGGSRLLESGQINSLIVKGRAIIQDRNTPWLRNDDLSRKDMSVNDIKNLIVKDINPDYGALGTKMNCRRCTFAYEMRRRGYNVAATRTTDGTGQNLFGVLNATDPRNHYPTGDKILAIRNYIESKRKGPAKINKLLFSDGYNGDKISSHQGIAKSIIEHLKKQPNGARGELSFNLLAGGAHSVAYEIIKGEPVIIDAQSGIVYHAGSKAFKDLTNAMLDVGATRLDNIAVNKSFLTRWLKDV